MNWSTLVFIILALGVSAASKVANSAAEKRKLKLIQAERERRRLEELRTGRVEGQVQTQARHPSTPAPPRTPAQRSADPSLQDLAERRKAQLAQLRQQQQHRAQQVRQPTASRPTNPSAPPIPPVSTSAAQRRPTGRLTPAQRAEAQRRIATQRKKADAPEVETETLRQKLESAHPLIKIPRSKAKKRKPDLPQSLDDWRRAIIAKEILSPPMALRDTSDLPG